MFDNSKVNFGSLEILFNSAKTHEVGPDLVIFTPEEDTI